MYLVRIYIYNYIYTHLDEHLQGHRVHSCLQTSYYKMNCKLYKCKYWEKTHKDPNLKTIILLEALLSHSICRSLPLLVVSMTSTCAVQPKPFAATGQWHWCFCFTVANSRTACWHNCTKTCIHNWHASCMFYLSECDQGRTISLTKGFLVILAIPQGWGMLVFIHPVLVIRHCCVSVFGCSLWVCCGLRAVQLHSKRYLKFVQT